jgi:hypothetical protein
MALIIALQHAVGYPGFVIAAAVVLCVWKGHAPVQ